LYDCETLSLEGNNTLIVLENKVLKVILKVKWRSWICA